LVKKKQPFFLNNACGVGVMGDH